MQESWEHACVREDACRCVPAQHLRERKRIRSLLCVRSLAQNFKGDTPRLVLGFRLAFQDNLKKVEFQMSMPREVLAKGLGPGA